jgi:hypothetical protein
MENARENAPNPTRVTVIATGVLNASLIAVPVRTGSNRYREAIIAKITVGATSMSRVNQGANFQNLVIFLLLMVLYHAVEIDF